MQPALRYACLIVGTVLATTSSYGQSTDGWPDWLKEAMATESDNLKTAEFEIEAGPYQFTLPKNTSKPSAFDGGWYFESDIGSDSNMECYVFSGDNDLATLTNNLAELSIQTIADANGGTTDNRSVYALDAGQLEGAPYISIEWFYTVGEAPNVLVGHTKVSAATNGAFTQACSHTAVGHRETFKGIFQDFVLSARQPEPGADPYYEEIFLQKLGEQPVGTIQVSYELDADGDTRIATTNAAMYPIGPDSVATGDSVTVTWSTPAGMLINTLTATSENGELVTDLSMARNADNDWLVSGTFQGKQLEHIIDGAEQPVSELGSVQIARDFFESDDTQVTFPMWISDADPTKVVQGEMRRDNKDTVDQATVSLGPLSMDASYDAAGLMTQADMHIGAATIVVQRIWHRGEIH